MSRDASCSGLASIIVPCCGQRAFTQLCIQALFRYTRTPWELIVVDNGSTDGTGAYLVGVRDAAAVPVTVIANRENLGFPRAINLGLHEARGEYLVLLSNDAVVTEGWLNQLVALASMRAKEAVQRESGSLNTETTARPSRNASEETHHRGHREHREGEESRRPGRLAQASTGSRVVESPHGEEPSHVGHEDAAELGARDRGIGLVGPMSNYAPPPQLVDDVPYRDLDEMNAFARRWRDEHRGQWFTAGKLSGFCLLLKRAVYEAIGGLDERFGIGFFDDDDLAVRARRAGFELAVARDLFVHHFGSRTFAGNGIDAGRLLEENARRFAEKWGDAAPAGRRVGLSPWGAGGAESAGGDGHPHGKWGQAPGVVGSGASTVGEGAGSRSPFASASAPAQGGSAAGPTDRSPGRVGSGRVETCGPGRGGVRDPRRTEDGGGVGDHCGEHLRWA
jgi:GT2 family glycosyltransferase